MSRLALTVRETATALGVSESTVYWMVYMKTIPHNRVKARGCRGRGKILIPVSALEKWLYGETPRQNENRRGAL